MLLITKARLDYKTPLYKERSTKRGIELTALNTILCRKCKWLPRKETLHVAIT